MTILQQDRAGKIAAWLGRLLAPGAWTELRALNVAGRKALARHYETGPGGLVALAEQALAWEAQGATGVYWIPNPLRGDLGTGSARDSDVLERRWLLVDIDPVRPAGVAATESEKLAAWEVCCHCRSVLLASGFAAPVVADSGNGWHLLYPMRSRNDEAGKAMCKQLLHGLSDRLASAAAKVDTTTYNAARIVRLWGTLSRKGEPTRERPHRRSRVIDIPGGSNDSANAHRSD